MRLEGTNGKDSKLVFRASQFVELSFSISAETVFLINF